MVARVEDDEAALLHEGVHLGERGVGERARVLAHRPIEDGEEGELVLVDVDAHGFGRLERGAGAQDLAQSRQSFFAGAIDVWVAGDDVSKMRLQRGLQREVIRGGGRHGRRGRGCCILRPYRGRRGSQNRQRQQGGGARRCGAAAPSPARAQQQQSENVSGKQAERREIEPGLERHGLAQRVTDHFARPFDRAQRLEGGLGGDEVEGAGGA